MELTKEHLRLLQRQYRSDPQLEQVVPQTLSEVRIDSLWIHEDELQIGEKDATILEAASEDRECTVNPQEDSIEAINSSTTQLKEVHAERHLREPEDQNEDEANQEFTCDAQYSTMVQNTIQVNPDAAAKVQDLMSKKGPQSFGISQIFDPNNRSMLFLERAPQKSSQRSRTREVLHEFGKLRRVLDDITNSDLSRTNNRTAQDYTTSKVTKHPPKRKSRIPKPQSYQLRGMTRLSKSKVDLRFPKLDVL